MNLKILSIIFGIVFISLFFQNVSAGCVGATYDFGCGATVNESCTLNGDMNCVGTTTAFTIGGNNIILNGNGYKVVYGSSTAGHGIYQASRQNNIIKNIILEQNTTSTSASYIYYDYNGVNNTIFNSTLYSLKEISSHHLLVLGSADDGNVSYNTVISTSGSTAIYISSGSYRCLVENNFVNTTKKSGYGIYIHNSDNATVLNNYITSDYELPILFYIANAWDENATLSGNKIYVNGAWRDVYFNKSLKNIEIANIDFNNYGEVICVNCNNVTYRNNTFRNHGLHLACNTTSNPIYIMENTFLGNNSVNIYGMYAYGVTVFNNTFFINETDNNLGYKYGIYLSQTPDVNISYNNMSSYGTNDYLLYLSGYGGESNDYIGYNNLLTNNVNAMAIYTINNDGDLIEKNNITIGNAGYGIYAYSSVNNDVIKDNNFYLLGSGTARAVMIYTNSWDINITDNYILGAGTTGTTEYLILMQRNVSNINIERNIFNFTATNNWNKVAVYNYDNNYNLYGGLGGYNINVNDNIIYGNTPNASTGYSYIMSYNSTGLSIDNLTIYHYNGGLDMFRCYSSSTPVMCQIDVKNSQIIRSNTYGESKDVEFNTANTLSESWVNFTNVSYNPDNIYWYATSTADFNNFNYLDVYVNYSNGTAINGAVVNGYYEDDSLAFTNTTNSSGYIERQVLKDYTQNYTRRLNYSNYKVNTSVDGKTDETSFNMTSSILKWLTIIANSCSPPLVGDWIINCSDNCLINSAISIPANMILSGSGEFGITNWNNLEFAGSNQIIALFSGCKIVMY